jgi:hypothetical protein
MMLLQTGAQSLKDSAIWREGIAGFMFSFCLF